ncbi:hypothetical protein E2C01_043369 [Portunus trituberculatus]|uniref:Uncharacterized protein n=1 Tax=Portunus trituberculatus TaxID=210409 RepID=A0A5B7FQ42_PORTR|nr:hypothetical protein [Portunus trituberculatus]
MNRQRGFTGTHWKARRCNLGSSWGRERGGAAQHGCLWGGCHSLRNKCPSKQSPTPYIIQRRAHEFRNLVRLYLLRLGLITSVDLFVRPLRHDLVVAAAP